MKRLLIGAAAIAAAVGAVAAHPVLADDTSATASDPRSGASVATLVNPILAAVPAPPSWYQRRVCFGDEQVGKAWCLYFPFPM